MSDIDWKIKLMQLLDVLSICEGTFYENSWHRAGISNEEKKEILKEWENYKPNCY